MGKDKYTVIVNGMGNIGSTLVNVLVRYRKELNLGKIYGLKRSIPPWSQAERAILEEKGVVICSIHDTADLPALLNSADYIFEATPNGVGLHNLSTYAALSDLKGSSAQGSEKGYGVPFMSGVNNEQIRNAKFVHIVSCNTHGTAALLCTFCGSELDQLARADVVVVRRSEDLGNHQRLVAASVVARHLDPLAGTHHAIDVVDLFKTKRVSCSLTSSDVTTPSQLMHSVRFNIELKTPLQKTINELVAANPFVSTTAKFDSNVIFELGRRYGFNGRIYSHAIVVANNLLSTDTSIKGWAFVPQEGNTILSTIHAFILQMDMAGGQTLFERIRSAMLTKQW